MNRIFLFSEKDMTKPRNKTRLFQKGRLHFFSSVRKLFLLFLLFFSSLLQKEHCWSQSFQDKVSFSVPIHTRFIAGYYKYFQVSHNQNLSAELKLNIIIAKGHNSLFNLNQSLILYTFSTVYIQCSKEKPVPIRLG